MEKIKVSLSKKASPATYFSIMAMHVSASIELLTLSTISSCSSIRLGLRVRLGEVLLLRLLAVGHELLAAARRRKPVASAQRGAALGC